MYKQSHNGYILRLADSAFVPPAPDNRDFQAYLSWVSAGNTAVLADPPSDDLPVFLPGLAQKDA